MVTGRTNHKKHHERLRADARRLLKDRLGIVLLKTDAAAKPTGAGHFVRQVARGAGDDEIILPPYGRKVVAEAKAGVKVLGKPDAGLSDAQRAMKRLLESQGAIWITYTDAQTLVAKVRDLLVAEFTRAGQQPPAKLDQVRILAGVEPAPLGQPAEDDGDADATSEATDAKPKQRPWKRHKPGPRSPQWHERLREFAAHNPSASRAEMAMVFGVTLEQVRYVLDNTEAQTHEYLVRIDR